MIGELVAPVLVIVVGWHVRKAFAFLKVPLDEAVFNSIVASIVAYLLALIGVEAGVQLGIL